MPTQLDHYRLLGRSGLKVSPLCLGTMTFGTEWGWGSDEATSRQIFEIYAEKGGNFIDTADLYTNGTSERLVGKFARDHGRDRFVIATKFTFATRGGDPNSGGNSRKHLWEALNASLERLGTDYIDLLWVHAFDGFTPAEELMRVLDDAVRMGKVNYVGVSDFPAWRVAQCNTLATSCGGSPFVALQVEYSLIERTVERELIPMADEYGLTVMPWSPLAQGVLSGKFLDGTADKDARINQNEGRMEGKYVSERAQQAVKATVDVARARGVSPSQVAVAWLLHRPTPMVPVVGARKPDHLHDNLSSLGVDLTDEELKTLDEASRIEPGFPHDFLLSKPGGMMAAGCTIVPPPGRRRLV